MQSLIQTTQRVLASNGSVPFAVIHSVKEQHIVNVPILKPLLICILDGVKQLGIEAPLQCTPGSFVFLSNHPNINMRNLPRKHHYFALLVEFEDSDFDCVPSHPGPTVPYVNGRIDSTLQKTLSQFVEWSAFAPSSLWPLRRQELLLTLYHLATGK